MNRVHQEDGGGTRETTKHRLAARYKKLSCTNQNSSKNGAVSSNSSKIEQHNFCVLNNCIEQR